MLRRTAIFALAPVSALAFSFSAAQAADHEDGSITHDRPADISDFHAFVNPNTGNIVLSMAINGFSVPGFINRFSPNTLLQIKIDNDGDVEEDLVIQFLFDNREDGQYVTILGPAEPSKEGASNKILREDGIEGLVGGEVFSGGDILSAFAGPTDDATWADLIFVESLLTGMGLGRDPGIDTVAGLNAATVAVEVAPHTLTDGNGDVVRVWATVSRQKSTKRSTKRDDRHKGSWIQIDRVGVPAVNPLLIPRARMDEYNRTIPSRDVSLFQGDVIAAILRLNGNDEEHAAFAASLLLPDVFVLDTTVPTVFPFGRMPDSDFVDASLGLLSNGGVTTDGLPANDVPFLDHFPFFAPAHAPSEVIPARN